MFDEDEDEDEGGEKEESNFPTPNPRITPETSLESVLSNVASVDQDELKMEILSVTVITDKA